ncbi:transposable element Tc1 transposase [Trichonephila clavipes]|nr:transposable element Tc1 transposase [Trichonephila clavipes]
MGRMRPVLQESGFSFDDIANRLDQNVSTVPDYWEQWSRDDTASRRPGFEQSRGTTERKDRRIRRTAVAHRISSATEIRVGTKVTQRTWCQARAHWRTEWRSVVFSDESKLCLSTSDGRVLVRRRPDELLQPNCLWPRHTGPTLGVMVEGREQFPMTEGSLSWVSKTH